MADDTTWSAKEVFNDLKSDIMGRFDKQDSALLAIGSRLDNTATKEDVAHLTTRIDGHERRINDLEGQEAAATVILGHKRRTWSLVGWGVLAGAAVATAIGTVVAAAH